MRSLQLVLRSFADTGRPETDGDLLCQFLKGSKEAFTEIVRRHGRLVWSVCRNLTRSDAEADDAFQATFLVLLRNAGRVRDTARLSAWLHGVAYRVCARARRTAQRRAAREQAAAMSERYGQVVADSAWDRALAAVHEEAGKLPESLRTPFVLCCLEGKGVTEAAEQLGWKLGTFSGRLTRAKNTVLARLDARGLTIGAVAGLGLSTPPAAAVAKAAALVQAGAIVPKSILQLTQGVLGMNATSFKVLAAAVVFIGGLGINAGTVWVATADAQQPNTPAPSTRNLEAEVKQLQDELNKAKAEAEAAARQAEKVDRLRWTERMVEKAALDAIEQKKATPAAGSSKWEYDFVAIAPMEQATFVKFLQARETEGWEFNGTAPMIIKGQAATVCVLRRPAKWVVTAKAGAALPGRLKAVPFYTELDSSLPLADVKDAKTIEAEIARLQAKLAAIKSKPAWERVVLNKLPLVPAEMADLLSKLAERKFGKGRFAIEAAGVTVIVQGDAQVIEWAIALANKLNEK
jgi:RNA polymerase sigma factor (sigma-70 family)